MDFFEFLNTAVTPYHTVDALKSFFKANSFTEIELGANLEPAKAYFVCREASIIAFRTPQKWSDESKFKIALAHTDFPTLKISPNPDVVNAGVCTLHTEVYGSPLYTSWLDRDLGYAGMLAYVEAGSSTLKTKLFRGEKLFRIPQLAVHLNRGVNQDGLKVNPQIDFNALWACASDSKASENRKNLFVKALEKELPEGSRLIDFDVQLFDAQSANRGGFNDEWIYSGRLDNLVLDSIASLQNDCHPGVREHDRAQAPLSSLASRLSSSIALSIDMAHAEHPNHTEKHELNHAPLLGKGIVLKTNSQKRYASDLMSSAQLRLLCEKAEIPLQVFIMRNDMPCGSTVGPTVSANLGIPTVDIGEPMLSMHSIREMMAASDHEDMIKLVKALYCYS